MSVVLNEGIISAKHLNFRHRVAVISVLVAFLAENLNCVVIQFVAVHSIFGMRDADILLTGNRKKF
jgi:hypothetical protein